jgi:hypothetical protein
MQDVLGNVAEECGGEGGIQAFEEERLSQR